MSARRVSVVGGGIIGLAVARRLLHTVPGLELVVHEKESRVAQHQTGHNSGVVHAGLYYQPGSAKALMCRRGVSLLREYIADKDIAHDEVGKLVIARDADELVMLEAIAERARANGVPGIRMLDADQIADVEPRCVGLGALHSPTTSIIDYVGVAEALAADVRRAGGAVRLGSQVLGLSPAGSGVAVRTGLGGIDDRKRSAGVENVEGADLVIACAGLQSDRLTPRRPTDPRIVPFFGDYLRIRPERSDLVRGLVYPVPDPRYPFLGVHFTRMVNGDVLIGPNAFLSLAREGYRRGAVNPRDLIDAVGNSGFWKFAARNVPGAWREVKGVARWQTLVHDARTFVPELALADVERAHRGVRAQAMAPDGSLVDDFVITERGPIIEVRNAPSPGATASLAIAEHIVERAVAAVGW